MTGVLLVGLWTAAGALSGLLFGAWTRRLLGAGALRPLIARLIAPALTAISFGTLAWRLGGTFDLLPYSYLAAVAVALGIVDTIEQRLPSALLFPSIAVLGVLFIASSIVDSNGTSLARALAGMVAVAGFYLILALASGGGLGAGDVKLGGLLGLALGWASWSAVLTGTVLGWVLGAVAWLTLRVTGRNWPDALPMGPFLLLGTLVTIGTMLPT